MISGVKAQLSLANTPENVKKIVIKFSGPELVKKTFSCEYKLTVMHSNPEKHIELEGKSLVSVSKMSTLVMTNINQSDINDYLIENQLNIKINISLTEKKHRPTNTAKKVGTSKRPAVNPNYISKNETGFVGLINQGATCYMNSMLQALYSITAFRRMIYNMPTAGTDDIEKSIPLNLQHLFYYMQTSTTAVTTKYLTRSFGWDAIETGFQQDIQEFCRVLLDNLETKLTKAGRKDEISQMFRGKMQKVIKAVDCPYVSTKDDYFYDITLTVDGYKTLEESLESLFASFEYSDYNTESEYGRRTVSVSDKLVELPPILFFHLSRFVYDNFGNISKLNSRFEFPKELDLSKYIEDSLYELTGVLVHSGSVNGGHYYAFLKPTEEPKWYRFDDSLVTLEKEDAAIRDNFGSNERYGGTSAYYLIYTKKNMISELYKPITLEEIPEHVKNTVKEIDNYNQKLLEQKESEKGLVSIDLIDETILKQNTENMEFGFLGKPIETVTIDRTQTTEDLYNIVSQKMNLDLNKFRLWLTEIFQIPVLPLLHSKSQKISIIRSFFTGNSTIFIQKKREEDPDDLKKDNIVVYLKFYFHETKKLVYLFSETVSLKSNINTLFKKVNEALGYPPNEELLVFQELQSRTANPAKTNESFSANLIDSGTILIFQRNPKSPHLHTTYQFTSPVKPETVSQEENTIYKILPHLQDGTVSSYFEEKFKMIPLAVYDYNLNEEKLLCKINFPPSISLPDFKYYISQMAKIEFDPEKEAMLLLPNDSCNGPSVKPISSKYHLRDLFCSNVTVLFMKIVKGIKDSEIEKYNNYKVQFSNDSFNIIYDDLVFMPKESTPYQLYQEIRKSGIEVKSGKLRCLLINRGTFSEKIDMIKPVPYDLLTVRIEVVPEHQENEDDGKIIPAALCHVDGFGTKIFFKQPFMAKIYNDKFEKTVTTIKNWLPLVDDDVKFTIVNPSIEPENDQNIFDELKEFSQLHIIFKNPKAFEKPKDIASWVTECSSCSCSCSHQRSLKIYN
ncbi:Clan CA, family C19, ubiquitin hydrolase-like cysteine peptidase [Trichomonas vaginalis G3]|uniref:Clan CA, family C19, ubiquitin hydrolase-like cysteine peptidase n=1 Tax=Trichomonas vaginalis (strain ATCC PRA-98 / G3) TaxID=412133 RepID=A2EEL3_TRIV3|nr:ubiquitinyl hydrolase protein [Trichomonas vaginalis G3]EAY08920.1 Clan CA, family C19, ubiquitin hydrolase-like cysteine peptidase [Trichomonas vaginalis G3]KAI5494386.1 ubiquitinyl hydrolase protein [Trichomonas vaginalis G3]|eukprot:XP_001321143.1 Clan CA, family C19, ubiquitin hydrolase-like cysteine peptidase [Trichomonas vaginalis G3]